MTRSELIQKQIDRINETCKKCKIKTVLGGECCALKLTLDLLLAEQKRGEGCDYCKTKECGTCSCNRFCKGKIQNGECVDTDYSYEADYFCKFCGRSLTEGESV